MVVKAVYDSPVQAPIVQGARVGTLRIEAPETTPREIPLYAGTSVGKLGVMSRLTAALRYIMWGENG